MSSSRKPEPVRVGLVTGEPIRMEGITSVFEELPGEGSPLLLPVFGSMPESGVSTFLSGGGSLNEFRRADFESEGSKHRGLLGHFLAQECN